LEFIPMIGPLMSGVVIVLIASVSGSHVLALIIFLLAYRACPRYILSSPLMRHRLVVHPLPTPFGVFAGAEFAGGAGTFLSVPVLALARIMYLRIRKARLSMRLTPEGTLT